MGRVIYIDGPEKSGKSTLIAELENQLKRRGAQVKVRRWGPVKPDDRAYSVPLREDLSTPGLVTIWDRGWVAEHVYSRLLGRQRRLATNPWLGEWLHGRAVTRRGAKVIVLPLVAAESAVRRDSTDLPVSVSEEISAFQQYAITYGYDMYYNDYNSDWVQSTASEIYASMPSEDSVSPEFYTMGNNPVQPRSIIIGEARNKRDSLTMAGAWLPFTSAKMCQFVQRYFGDGAFNFAWTNAEDVANGKVPLAYIQNQARVYTFGESARAYIRDRGIEATASFAHPSYFSRWNTDRGRAALHYFEQQYKQAFDLE